MHRNQSAASKPIDGTIQPDQGSSLAVPDQGVVFNPLRHDAGLFSLERVEPELIRLSSQFDLSAEFHNTFGRDLKVEPISKLRLIADGL
jgi:hypothetical protein